jgi:hypothetical protein
MKTKSLDQGEKVMKKLTVLFVVVALMGLAGGVMAQTYADHVANVTVNAFNVIRVAPVTAVTLTISAPATPGDPSAVATNSPSSTYLQYTAIKNASNYKISAAFQASTMPTGTSLAVTAATPVGAVGTPGTSAGKLTIPASGSVDLITGIGSVYTGVTGTSGSQLTYELSVSNWTTVVSATSTPITVRYTIL